MTITQTARFNLNRWGADTDEVTRLQFVDLVDELESKAAIGLQGLRSARPAPGVPRREYLATDTGVIYKDDGSQWRVVGSRVVGAVATPDTAAGSALTVQGLAGQSEDVQVWLNSAGATLAAVSPLGTVSGTRLLAVGRDGAVALSAVGKDPAQPVATVQGASGQTAHLQRWLNDAGQHVVTITTTGDLRLAGDLDTRAVTADTVTAAGAVTATGGLVAPTGRFSTNVAAPNLTGSATSHVGLHYYAVKTTAAQIPDNVVTVLAGWNREASQGTFDYDQGVITVPLGGRWALSASAQFEVDPNGGRLLQLVRGNSDGTSDSLAVSRIATPGTAYPALAASTSAVFNAGDTFSVQVLQQSGRPLTVGKIGGAPARFTLDYLGAAA